MEGQAGQGRPAVRGVRHTVKIPALLAFLPDFLALHVIAVILWMAGMLVLPLVYLRHRALAPSSAAAMEFVTLERQIFKRLLNPSMYAAWGFGILLILTPGTISWDERWWQVKFTSVLVLSWYHGMLSAWRRKLRDGGDLKASVLQWTVAIPFALTALIVTMVVIQP